MVLKTGFTVLFLSVIPAIRGPADAGPAVTERDGQAEVGQRQAVRED